jgi:hypothetical protein
MKAAVDHVGADQAEVDFFARGRGRAGDALGDRQVFLLA